MFSSRLPHLHDCRRSAPGNSSELFSELFIVEGVSASLAVCAQRDPETQAVLCMQGKPVNAYKASARVLRENVHLQELRSVLGYGNSANAVPAVSIDVAMCRYQQIVLLFDPDADGIHCGALVLLYLYQQFPSLLAAGRIGVVRPPLFELSYRATALPGALQESRYAYTDAECRELQRKLNLAGVIGLKTQRMRGLGGMPTELLRTTCIDRPTRHWFPLTTEDARSTLLLLTGGQCIS